MLTRDADGQLQEILQLEPSAYDSAEREGAVRESWMHLEIDRETDDAECSALADRLGRVLDDVRVAVQDWPAMVDQARSLAEELDAAPPPGVDPTEVEDGRRLLRWLADGNFTFLGYREYRLAEVDGEDALVAVQDSGLGILREDGGRTSSGFGRLTPQARRKAREKHVLVLTKANARSTVHRPTYLDYIGVKAFDAAGEVVGERRFLGLWTSAAYTRSVSSIPVLERKVSAVLERAGFSAESHSGKDVLAILETYPRNELFEIELDDLYAIALSVMHLQERRRTRLYLRQDPYGRFVSCLVYLPRDRYTTAVRLKMQAILLEALGGRSVDYTTRVTESVLARLHFVVRLDPGREPPEINHEELQARLIEATRSWDEAFEEALLAEVGEEEAARLQRTWRGAFPEGYKEDALPRVGVADLKRLEALDDDPAGIGLNLYEPVGARAAERRFKVYRTQPLSLSAVLPFLANLGVEVVDERPYVIERANGDRRYVYDFGLRYRDGFPESPAVREAFADAFLAAWAGRAESDGLDRLVLLAGLGWRQVALLRTYTKYLRQTGTTFSQDYLVDCLCTHVQITADLARLFRIRFDPQAFAAGEPDGRACQARLAAANQAAEAITAALEEVASLDHDRILRAFLALVQATLRTNFYLGSEHIAVKLDPARVPELPAPRPAFEIFVYSPRVEGVHLRFGKVARGGLRWSDRREDFRTEILGLVKAQTVKNAVIVPTGAKGGFVGKRLPDPARDREAWLAEGIACYRTFISGLLEVTDNRRLAEDGSQVVVPPRDVVRHDDEDPYLVVAADKGTATFSDLANAEALEAGFWLGDAFASGGSAGYDHKSMGITAKGAWESVRRHFRELGRNVQTDPVTVVGVGDMSGDVFGNGMLLSRTLRLVAAFDHRHIFLDPDPDPEVSYAERQRLFALPRSSWADYDPEKISAGGGVFERSAKSVQVSPQVAGVLGLASGTSRLTPQQLLQAVLRAPVDLLWNGGIGTYVKAAAETNGDVGDKANDGIRVDGRDLRVKVVGEGGNLGLTQLGRVEAALNGVRVNTDALDNSAGVDCSDHEVNIKILLDRVVADGDLTGKQRNALLAEMTDEVAALVLGDNYEQNALLGMSRAQAASMAPVHLRLMRAMEQRGQLDRSLEFLPDEETLERRMEEGGGLTSPEFAVLAAYAKITLDAEVLASALPDDPWLEQILHGYFPAPLVERYQDRMAAHPLRREIITNALVNEMVNRGGITFSFRAQEETGASAEQVARAFLICQRVFDLPSFTRAVHDLDDTVSTKAQTALNREYRRLLDRSVRWFLQVRAGRLDVGAEVERFRATVRELAPAVPDLMVGSEAQSVREAAGRLRELGVPEELATRGASLLNVFQLLDVTEIAESTGRSATEVAGVYFALSDRYGVDAMLTRISGLERRDRWQALARAALRYDLYSALDALTIAVLTSTAGEEPDRRVLAWEETNADAVARSRQTLEEVRRLEKGDIASLSVALRTLRSVVRSTS